MVGRRGNAYRGEVGFLAVILASSLTKGIPGRLFWKLLQAFVGTGRAAFTNKEIRLDASMGLLDIKDNLEARLILLRRRLDERCAFMKLIPAGRRRLHLDVRRTLALEELP